MFAARHTGSPDFQSALAAENAALKKFLHRHRLQPPAIVDDRERSVEALDATVQVFTWSIRTACPALYAELAENAGASIESCATISPA